ncbi:hypothetical protein WSK_4066 [Novosphingobium sp. Rr 2-17]|uniref:hypothetical protein n=1 Tax=Novosphingobium sp. Rr 2-17 TaxID=555793 RepID=UPI0002699F2D|nr:hypothetical protein [Novosphingobium sp. Rr 2-17]EIZ77372.1 hypothetical protein WSK_4066 [Novosphingobium sp. Rr 2-17]
MLRFFGCLLLLLASTIALPAQARESLGLYAAWGAFRDPLIPRCYAIAMADPSAKARDYQAYTAIGTWPARGARGQVHFRLSRKLAANARITLSIGGNRMTLIGGGGDAWPANETDNAAILAAMRSAPSMTVSARDARGLPFANRYTLAGAASAMDAALIGCARVR